MKRFFEAVIEPIFNIEKIRNIVEIGSEKGLNTAKLIGYANKFGGKIYSIDPVPGFDSEKWERENPESFVMIKDLSLNAIKNISDADCFLIDGDHNWYTVYSELNEIFRVYGEKKFPLVFFHDILWPYDRRDLYYSPETIPEIYRHDYEMKAIAPDSAALSENGINGRHFNAKKYGGSQNGVLTAVEDFIKEHSSLGLELLTHDVLFGLGMLASKERHVGAVNYFYSSEALKGAMKACEKERVEQAVKIDTIHRKLSHFLDKEKTFHIGKVYPDYGEGFSEATAVSVGSYNKESDGFYAEVSFEKAPDTVRFDPAEESGCIVDHITVIDECGIIEPESSNGIKYGGIYFFENRDPKIIYRNVSSSRKFKIKASIYPFKSIAALTFVDKLLTDNHDLVAENNRLVTENDGFVGENNRLQSENSSLEAEKRSMEADIEELQRMLKNDSERFDLIKEEKSKELSVFRSKLAESDKRNDKLAKDLKSKNTEIENTKAVIRSNNEVAKKFLMAGKQIGWKYALKAALKRGLFATKTNVSAIKMIRKSGDFDVLSYCRKYPDVIKSGIDPLVHFIWFGGYEGRNPTGRFNSKKYLAAYHDVSKSGVNPYAHFVVLGKKEGRNAFAVVSKSVSKSAPKSSEAAYVKKRTVNGESSVILNDCRADFSYRELNYTAFSEGLKALKKNAVSIIVPIYNAYDETKECIEHVLKNTKFPYKLMLINDCSTDERIGFLLEEYKNRENITIIQNERNLGFVQTMNYGMTHTDNDVVFLNSDTRVTEGWLRKLAVAAYHKDNVATVTPFSNAAGAFSVPIVGENKEIPAGFDLDIMSAVVERCSRLDYVNVPTGNGFCMYITRKAINAVGVLDHEAFSRGYGEENDFCMRAKKAGFINVVADDTYIYHKRSASFKEEKQQLIANNRKILDERYPSYTEEIKIFSDSEQLISDRHRIREIVDNNLSLPFLRKRLLYVLHEGGGGTVKTNEDLMQFVNRNNMEVFMLTSNTNQFKLYSVTDGGLNLLHIWKLKKQWEISDFYIPEYADLYFDVICNLHIDLIHVRHLFKHSFDIVEIADMLQIPVVMSFHDFYFICPTINLVNSETKYCNAKCRECDAGCRMISGLIKIDAPINRWTQDIWRKEIGNILPKVSTFVTTSEYTRRTYLKVYPELEDRFHVIEHGRDFPYDRSYRGRMPSDGKIIILLAGNIDINKGGEYIKKLIDLDKSKKLEFHCIGALIREVGDWLEKDVINHGKYVREDFVRLVAEIKPSYIGIFSIWPETYCHVLTEAWSCGIPCIVSDIGTLKERADAQGGCIKADLDNPEKTYKEILDVSFSDRYQELCNEVQKADIHSIDRMGSEYMALYHSVLKKGGVQAEILIWVNNFNKKRVASSYVRVVSPIINNPVIRKKMAVIELRHATDIPFDSRVISKIYVLIQREKIDGESVGFLQKAISEYRSVDIIFEIDDDLLGIGRDHPEYAAYKENITKIRAISEMASKIIVANETIAKSMHGDRCIIPNFIDNRLWNMKAHESNVSDKNNYKILYFGTFSHKKDLMIMKNVMERLNNTLRSSDKQARLVVVGVSDNSEEWYDVLRVPGDAKEYPQFVRWLKSVNDFDIGIAPLDLKNTFNYAKSPLKYLEYSALGLPCVCTDIEPYREAVKTGENGFRIRNNSIEEWMTCLLRLIMDNDLRSKIVRNASMDLMKNYMLCDNFEKISDTIFGSER